MPVRIEHGSAIREALLVSQVLGVPAPKSFVRCMQAAMRHLDERLLDGPYVLFREPPVRIDGPQVENPIPVDSAREVDVRVDVGKDEIANGSENGLAPVEPRVPRPSDGAISGSVAKQEDDVVDVVSRFEVEEDRREPMLLEDRRRGQCGFEAMGLVRSDDTTKRAKRLSAFLDRKSVV